MASIMPQPPDRLAQAHPRLVQQPDQLAEYVLGVVSEFRTSLIETGLSTPVAEISCDKSPTNIRANPAHSTRTQETPAWRG
ncbi:MAG TPA: hypothetical protein VGM94_15160, partial [Galbitalea sp.]